MEENQNFDLILLDYEMPLMNGKEVLQEIRTSYENYTLPVIFLTAKNDKETIQSIVGLQNAALDWSFTTEDVPDISDAKSFVNANQ